MIKEASETIQKVRAELGKKPKEASRVIQFLNSKKKYELQDLGLSDRTKTILEVKKVITKRNLMIQIEEKCQNMKLAVDRFMVKFDVLRKKGLHNPLVINNMLMKQEEYGKKLREVAKEQPNNSSMKGIPT